MGYLLCSCAKFVKEASSSADTSEYYTKLRNKDYCKNVMQCIKSCLEWSDLELMSDTIAVLNTLDWEKLLEENNPFDEILRLVTRFKVPLEGVEASTEKIH